jgi:hypothetical protein
MPEESGRQKASAARNRRAQTKRFCPRASKKLLLIKEISGLRVLSARYTKCLGPENSLNPHEFHACGFEPCECTFTVRH